MSEIDWSKHKVWSSAQILAAQPPIERWGSPIEMEVRRRITLSIATYAYEIADQPFMTDHDWDRMAQIINPRLGTCHPLIDEFFARHFSPMTGMWIHEHPELPKVKRAFERYYSGVTKDIYDDARRRGKL